jgi:ribonuclease E
MSKMLFNAARTEELRVAVIKDNILQDLLFEQSSREQKKANIYMGRITRIEPSLEAAFIDYGQERHGFLPLKEIAPEFYPEGVIPDEKISITKLLKEGQELLVQVDKEERGNKGAALSTMISLAGSYLVLMPNNNRAGGVSRRIEGAERTELKEKLSQLEMADGMGVIIRTAGVGKSIENLQWDLNYLQALWKAVKQASTSQSAPFLVYQESDVIFRAIRDYLRPDIDEIIVDDQTIYEKICKHIGWLHPDFVDHIKLHNNATPLFVACGVEEQIESVFQREVRLPSGGSIVIDRTEALVAIDINSARSTKGSDIEETALNTNLEAAVEIAKQLRLRDLGGLVVIDFIDMGPVRHQRQVEEQLEQALSADRARIQTSRISRFGLLELSRQRLRSSVGETTQEACPRCSGRGTIRSIESLSTSVVRMIDESASKNNVTQVNVQVPVEVGTYLLNEKRVDIAELEEKHSVTIFLIPNPSLETPQVEISTLKGNKGRKKSSHKMLNDIKKNDLERLANKQEKTRGSDEQPAVKDFVPERPAPVSQKKQASNDGLITRLFKHLFGNAEEEKKAANQKTARNSNRNNNRSNNNRRRNNNSNRRQSAQGNNEKRQQQNRRTPENKQQRNRNSNKRDQQAKPVVEKQNSQEQKQGSKTNNNRRNNSSENRGNRNRNRRRSNRPDMRPGEKQEQQQSMPFVSSPVDEQKQLQQAEFEAKQRAEKAEQQKNATKKPQAKPAAPKKAVEAKPAVKATKQEEAEQAKPVVKTKPTKPKKQYGKVDDGGSKQIETVAGAAQAAPVTPPKPKGKVRPPRVRKPKVEVEMKMIETNHKSDNG